MIKEIATSVSVDFDVTRDGFVLEHLEKTFMLKEDKYEVGVGTEREIIKVINDIAHYLAVFTAAEEIGAKPPHRYKNVRKLCGATYCAEDISGTPFDYKVLDIFVTGTVYRILRMAARGKAHIYGLSDKEYYKRMSMTKEKYNHRQSDDLLKLFKEGKISTEAKV